MRKLTILEWAAIGELIGTAAIIVSLFFVAYSIERNTAIIQGSTENLIFERHADLTTQFMLDRSLAEILVKMRRENPQLDEVESVRWEKYQLNLLDIWALAFNRHDKELLADSEWQAWDEYFSQTFSEGAEKLTREQWNALKYGYSPPFWRHVAGSLFAAGQ
ncbi:MAG: hypothetical protein R3192_00905 [Woeseiaceae bacterium]|nr:hypothetical protein [Woeseiaceae bacterium]